MKIASLIMLILCSSVKIINPLAISENPSDLLFSCAPTRTDDSRRKPKPSPTPSPSPSLKNVLT